MLVTAHGNHAQPQPLQLLKHLQATTRENCLLLAKGKHIKQPPLHACKLSHTADMAEISVPCFATPVQSESNLATTCLPSPPKNT